jgi:nucleotide-binding universal stress UspA family protein
MSLSCEHAESTIMFKRILIPLDGSRLAEQALDPGLALAKVFGSQVTLPRVLPVPDVGPSQSTS